MTGNEELSGSETRENMIWTRLWTSRGRDDVSGSVKIRKNDNGRSWAWRENCR